jgi:hypothetical protein
MSLNEFAAGDEVAADDLNRVGGYGECIARARRETSSTAASAETGVLRLDDIPVEAGHLYEIKTNNLSIDTSIANDVARILLRIDETGADATTSSTNIALAQRVIPNAAAAENIEASTTRPASASGSWSVLLSTVRQTGTGNIQLVGGAVTPIELYVIDLGLDPGDTGVDI